MDSLLNPSIKSPDFSHPQPFNQKLHDAKQILYPPFFSLKSLSETILTQIQAEPDSSFQASMALHRFFRPQLRLYSHDLPLLDAWDQLYNNNIQENRLFHSPEYFLKDQEAEDLIALNLEARKEAFRGLETFIQAIKNMQNQVEKTLALNHKEQISEALTSLEKFYSGYKGQVSSLVNEINEKKMILQLPYDQDLGKLSSLLKPKALLFGDIFPEGTTAFRISQETAQRIIAEENNFKASNNSVFKEIEQSEMVHSLYRLLDIPVVQKSPLFLVEDTKKTHFFELSEALPDTIPIPEDADVSENHHKNFCLQVLGTLLTTPSNPQFIYDPIKHGPILNNPCADCYFNPAFDNSRNIKSESPLYSLPQMDRPLPDSLLISLRTLSADLLLLAWLNDLETKRKHRQQLISACLLYSEDLPQPKFTIPKALIESLRTKLSLIINSAQDKITPQSLLEAVFPALGAHYKALRNQHRQRKPIENPSPLELLDPFSSQTTPLHDALHSLRKAYFKKNPNPLDSFMEKYSEYRMNQQQLLDKLQNSQMDQQEFLQKHPEYRLTKQLDPQEALRELLLYLELTISHVQNARNFVDLWCKGRKIITQDYHAPWDLLFFSVDNLEVQWYLALDKYLPRDNSSNYQPHDPREVRGALISKRQLSEELQKDIFNQQQSLRPVSLVRFPRDQTQAPVFYIKKGPEFPGYEYAVTLFLREFGVEGIPFCELLMMKDPQQGLYPAMLMQAIEGKTLEKTWLQNDHIFEGLEPHHTQMLILGSMLLNPEDGRASNFILTKNEKRIIPIHNGHVFVPGFITTKNTKELLNKTILYCLPEMNKPIQESVIQRIVNLDIDNLLNPWLARLLQISERSYHLPSDEARASDGKKGIFYRVGFPQNFIEKLYEKFHKMQEKLSTNDLKLRPFDLLIELEPEVGKVYQEVFLQESTVRNRFSKLTENLYKSLKDPRYSSIDLLEILGISSQELVEKNYTPEIGPGEALSIVKSLSQAHNKIFSYMNLVKERVRIDMEDAEKLEGEDEEVEFIKKKLENQQHLQILALKNSSIKNFNWGFVQSTALKALILPNAKNLTQDALKILGRSFKNLESLVIGENKYLMTLALEQDDFKNLKHLNVSNCKSLIYLRVEVSGLEALEIAGNKNLKIVGLMTTELKYLDCREEKIEVMFVKKGVKNVEVVGRSVEEQEEKMVGIELFRAADIVEKLLLSDVEEKAKQDILRMMFHEGVKKALEKKLKA